MDIKEVKLDLLSYSAVPLRLMVKSEGTEKEVSLATGFYVRYKGKVYLITNWHVVTGVESTNKYLRADRPQYINYPTLKHKKPHIQWNRLNTQLYSDGEMEKPTWLVHPEFGEKVDVVAIEIGMPLDNETLYLNEFGFDKYKPLIADDIYILGFPYGNRGGGNFPIWKKGSIATEPDIPLDGLPKMYVDTASREGMSGAPVIYRRRGVHGLEEGKLVAESVIGEIQNFVGVYSGRIKNPTDRDNLEAQLGIVWDASVIREIILGGRLDDIENLSAREAS